MRHCNQEGGVMDALTGSLLGALVFSLGAVIGHFDGHSTAAIECERLGAFYVYDKVFECKIKGK